MSDVTRRMAKSETQVNATPSKAARRLAYDLGFGSIDKSPDAVTRAEEIIQSALSDLLEKAETLRCAFGGYAPAHGCACNNCGLANALEPWKPK